MSETAPAGAQIANGKGGDLLVNVNLILTSHTAISLMSFLVVIVTARSLGPDGRGVIVLFQSAAGFGHALLSLGAGAGVIYFMSRSEISLKSALETGVTMTLAAALVTGLVVGTVVLLSGDRLDSSGVPYWFLVAAVPLGIQFRIVESALRSLGRFVVVSIIEVMGPAIMLIGFVTLTLLDALTVSRAIAVTSLVTLLPVVFAYRHFRRDEWPRGPLFGPRLTKVLRFGMAGQLGNIIQTLNYRLDSYLVLLFVNTAGVGIYAAGVSLSEAVWLIANSVTLVLLPRLSAADDAYRARMTPLVCRTTLIASFIAAAGLALVSPIAVPLLFGGDFKGSVVPLLLLLPGTVALSASKVLSAYIFSRGRPFTNTLIALATFSVMIAGDLILIPLFDVRGAAIASTLAYTVSLTLTATVYRSLSGRAIWEALVPRFSDVAIYTETARTVFARLRPVAGRAGSGS